MSIYTVLDLEIFNEQLTHFAKLENFWQSFEAIYGSQYDQAKVATLKSQWQTGDFSQLPTIEVVSYGDGQGAEGFYDSTNNTIYLSDRLLATASQNSLNAIILENIGLWLNVQVEGHHLSDNQATNRATNFAQAVLGQSVESNPFLTTGSAEIISPMALNTLVMTQSQLTNNSTDDVNPRLSGNYVAWRNWDGIDHEIYLYNGSSTVQLTNNSLEEDALQVSGNNLVWQGSDGVDNEIYFYNGSTTLKLTNNSTNDTAPQVSGNNVVWQGWDGHDYEIYLYNGTATVQLTNNNTNETAPQIEGNRVVWVSSDDKVYIYNGTTTTKLANLSSNNKAPQISGNNVVWVGEDGTDTEIYLYNGTSILKLTNNLAEDSAPQVSGNNVVWWEWDGIDNEVYFYNGTNTLRLTNNSIDDFFPEGFDNNNHQISGNYVVWSGDDGYDTEIYLYNGTSTVQLTNNSEDDSNPQIVGNYVTWSNSDGYDDEISLANLDPPTISVSISPSSVNEDGTTNLVYAFTRTGSLTSTQTVNYILGGTATNGGDYSILGSSVTFAAGSNTTTLTVDPTADTTFEANETVTLTIANGSYVIITPTPITGTIVNDDTQVTLAVAPSSVNEDGTSNLIYTFTRAGNISNALTVNYTIGGTATIGVDYATVGTSITFAAGASTTTLTVDPIADSLGEFNETVDITLTSGTGYSIGTPAIATGTITNDDTLFSEAFDLLLLQDLTGSFGDDIATVRTLVPNLVAGINSLQPNTPIGVSSFLDKPISPFGGSYPTDYVYLTKQALTTNASTIQSVYNGLSIGSGGDAPEAQLEALLQVALRSSEIGFNSGTKRVVVLFTDAPYHQAGDGAAIAGIPLPNNLDAVLDGTPPGTGEDYPTIPSLKQLLIDANILPIFAVTSDQVSTYQNLVTQLGVGGSVVQLSTNSSNIINAIEQGLNNLFLVNINVPSGGLVTNELGTNAAFTVVLNAQPSSNVTIGLHASDSTEGSLSTNSIVFTPTNWNIVQTVTVTGIDDPEGSSLRDGDQTYQIITDAIVSSDVNYYGVNPIDITIVNQDGDLPNITLALSSSSVVEDGDINLIYTFTRTGDLTNALTINYLIGGTAVNGVDYSLIGTSATFAANAATTTVIVDPLPNNTTDDNKTISLAIASSPDYLIGTSGPVIGTILDDDGGGLTITGTANDDNLVGGIGNDTLIGLAGNDTLDGKAGIDNLQGGTGNDLYIVDNLGDIVTEKANEGTDTVQSSVTHTLKVNVENLILTGTAATNGTGNTLNNTITGNSANNVLNGSTGTDNLNGGLGNDTYVVDNLGDIVTETSTLTTEIDTVQASINYTLGANLEKLTLTGTAVINGTGNALNNTLTGNGANNSLTGGDGNDTLNGGAGIDTLVGGLGNDIYSVDTSTDIITELDSQGTDTIQSTVTFSLAAIANLENLTLTGSGVIDGTGNLLNNLIVGNSANNLLSGDAGNDTLTGNAGSDILVGGLGNDTLNLGLNDGASDIVRYTSGDGTDIINQFIKGSDKLAFAAIAAIDVKVSGTDTQLRLGNGIAGDTGFGSGTLLATIKGVTGFTTAELGIGGTSLDATNTAKFLFS